ncbi:ABC transporter permease [Neobacillus terrae]|uniref:ABC transporter permease n=1 Tax=Neobacillus terrae TaxID=3034837 RepID=UPI00140E8369|nr:ABC transporter permease subunit [Neobacillus terrae]NHM31279.1 ABC transporter permease subunit [Neobacillus terrae]
MNKHLLFLEYKKIFKRKKNIIVICLIIVISLGILILNNLLNKKYESNKAENYKYQISSINEAISQIPREDRNRDSVKKIEEEYKNEIKLLEQQANAFEKGNWKEELKAQIIFDENQLKNLKTGKAIGGEPIQLIESRIGINKQLIKKNIKPINESSATQGIYFLRNILNILFGFMGVIIMIFIVGDILAIEFDKGTINFLFTQSISREKIVNTKSLVAFSFSIFSIFTVSLFAFLIGSLFWGTGSFDYPISIQREGTSTFINIGQYLTLSGLLFIFVLIFTISVAILISVITSSSMIAISLTVILSSMLYLSVNKYGYFAIFAQYLPFSYFNTFNIIDGTLASNLKNNNISLKLGIEVLLVSSLLLHFISLRLIRKKEVF